MKTIFKKNDGFTLVELIVVIAILAILAAVAIPAYSGYIEKANRAGDETLLAAVNKAFASACSINGDDVYLVKNVKNIKLVDGKIPAGDVSPYGAEFEQFYGENMDAQFKVIKSLVFDVDKCMFVDPASETAVTVNYKGSNITVSGNVLQNLSGSTFGDIGSDALLDQIGTVTGAAALMAGSLEEVFTDDSFNEFAMTALGATTQQEYSDKIASILEQMCDPDGDGEEDVEFDEAYNQLQANIAVLYASKHAVDYSEQQINDLFAGGAAGVKNNLLGANASEGMAQAALIYGMYTAYANSAEYGNDELKEKANNPVTVLNALDRDENFKKYLNSEQGKSDLSAYQGALGVIVDTTSNNGQATTDLLVNGFDNDELKGVMSGLIG